MKKWEFPNQFQQEGAILSPPLRAQLLLRNYQLCAKNSLLGAFDSVLQMRLIHHVAKTPVKSGGIKILAIDEFSEGSRAVLSFGIKRVFSYEVDNLGESPLGLPSPETPLETANLAVEVTEKITDLLPGTVYEVDALPEVAEGLYFEKVRFVDFDAVELGTLPPVEEAYVLVNSVKKRDALPHQSYLNVCLEGAKRFGKRFLKLFTQSTYLADGRTTILEWLRNEVIHMNLEMLPATN